MLIFNKEIIGNNLYNIRKKKGMTQAETAEKAEISDKAYAEIERGTVNMRIETLLHICEALNITPDEILTEEENSISDEEIFGRLGKCSPKEREAICQIINIYLSSK